MHVCFQVILTMASTDLLYTVASSFLSLRWVRIITLINLSCIWPISNRGCALRSCRTSEVRAPQRGDLLEYCRHSIPHSWSRKRPFTTSAKGFACEECIIKLVDALFQDHRNTLCWWEWLRGSSPFVLSYFHQSIHVFYHELIPLRNAARLLCYWGLARWG